MFRLTAGAAGYFFRFTHALPERIVRADFRRFPLAACRYGVVIGTSTKIPAFLAVVDPGGATGRIVRWHRHINFSIGIPTVVRETVFLGAGGPGAMSSIVAIDCASGSTRWSFPHVGPIPAEIRFGEESDPWPEATGRQRSYRKSLVPVLLTDPAYPYNPGLVASGTRIHGIVNGAVVALEQENGSLAWSTPLPAGFVPLSLVGSRDHLFLSAGVRTRNPHDARGALMALRLKDGKPMWIHPVPDLREGGSLSLAGGQLFLADGYSLRSFGPAERTFRLAIDSPKAELYLPDPEEEPGAAEPGEGLGAGEEPAAERDPAGEPVEKPAAPTRELADATVLRLSWAGNPEERLRKARERRAAAPRVPLALVLDWLNPARSGLVDGSPGWTPERIEAFSRTCARLAGEVQPEYFEIASDLNVYLSRVPQQRAALVELLRSTRAAIRGASPRTKVLVSLNAEHLAGRYGRGDHLPFGKVAPLRAEDAEGVLALAGEADGVALTCYPRAGFAAPEDLPHTYLLALKAALGPRPLAITRLGVYCDGKNGEKRQAEFVWRILQACYWLDAEVVAHPDLAAENPETAGSEWALRVDEHERQGLAPWKDVFAWKRVARLSLAPRGPETPEGMLAPVPRLPVSDEPPTER